VLSAVLLDPRVLGHELGWRAAFGLGALLALAILIVRRFVPESPRWLLVRGRHAEAEAIVCAIEARCPPREGRLARIRIAAREPIGFGVIARVMLSHYRSRALLGLVLMVTQAFFYNAIFFTYALTLTSFYAVPAERVGAYLLPFALGNFLGPLLLGRLFDAIGRRPMIAFTYAASGVLLLATGAAFARGALDARTHTLLWSVSFFFASAAASSAYLTVGEIFPLEIRALAIAFFYAIGTGIGGMSGPWLFGVLIDTGSRWSVFGGYLLGAALMILAALIAARFCVPAERKSLEAVAPPLSVINLDLGTAKAQTCGAPGTRPRWER
jgi:MFS family permease